MAKTSVSNSGYSSTTSYPIPPFEVIVYKRKTKNVMSDIDRIVGVITGFVRGKKVLRSIEGAGCITPWMYVPLMLLYENDGWRLRDLCKRLNYDHGNMWRMMNRLTNAGLVHRDSAKAYHLTSAGTRVVAATLAEIRSHSA